jgi:tRNA nucleotidyltransferase (CCA-adding enzyme)
MEVITTHINSDFDSLASMLAAKKLYPDAVLVFPGSQERTLRDFFISSTFYLFQTKKMKEIDMDKVTRLVLVDTRQKSRIGRFKEILGGKGLEVVIFDHHPKSSDDIVSDNMEIASVGSTTTIMTEILKKKRKHITAEEATVMMLGIYEDTGSLTFSTTTERDYNAAAYLLKNGANLNVVSDLMTKELTSTQVQMLNEFLSNMKTFNIHGVDVVVSVASSDEYVGDLAVLVHKLKDIENLDAVVVLARMEDRIYLIARSRIEAVNVGSIAEAFDGGGHSSAASATIKDLTLIQAKNKLLKVLHEKIKPKKAANDIMVYPVRVVDSEADFKKAQDIMSKFQLSTLPVVSNKKVVGLITRNIVEKALYHKLGSYKIEEYMIRDFSVVKPNTPLFAIQELIIDNNQKIVPVMKGKEITGVITRTDLLRIFSSNRTDESMKKDRSDVSGVLRKRTLVKMMEDILSKDIRDTLKKLGRAGDLLGYNVYAVGGFVRDLILRTENLDIDIVVEGDGIHYANEFAKLNDCHINCHRKFRTAVIKLPNGLKVDIASARVEYYKHPAALPEIEVSSIKLDLYRRDFTVNTLALKLNHKDYGELVDYFAAYKDIKAKMIRVLHNLSFVEDPTRVFRAVRFEQRFKFNIDKHTLNLIKNAGKIDLFDKLSGKRLLTELKFMFEESEPIRSLSRLETLNLFKFVHKKIVFSECRDTLLSLKEVLTWFDLMFLDEKYKKWLVYFIVLIEPLTASEREEIKKRLSISDNHSIKVIRDSEKIETLLKKTYTLISCKSDRINSEAYHLLESVSTEVILYMMAKTDNNQVKKLISRYFTHLKQIEVITTGNDLIGLGFKAGKDFKEIFLKVLNEKLNGNIKTKENEVRFIKSLK